MGLGKAVFPYEYIEKKCVTSQIKILIWCNIYNLPSSEIVHVNIHLIYNISSSRQFLTHIYSCRNFIIFNSIVLFFPHEINNNNT